MNGNLLDELYTHTQRHLKLRGVLEFTPKKKCTFKFTTTAFIKFPFKRKLQTIFIKKRYSQGRKFLQYVGGKPS